MVKKIFLTALLGASTLFGADVGMKDLTDMQNFYIIHYKRSDLRDASRTLKCISENSDYSSTAA